MAEDPIGSHDRDAVSVLFNAVTGALVSTGHWMPLSERMRITLALYDRMGLHKPVKNDKEG